MISFLRGRPVSCGADYIIIDVGGVGYKVFTPIPAAAALGAEKNEVTVHTYLHVREDAMQLYGFLSENDLEVFEHLIQVSGIGPKAALAILSSMNASSIVQTVVNEQVDALISIPGIGKKTAQRIIIELKDKMSRLDAAKTTGIPAFPVLDAGTAADALQALIALGYNSGEARRALGRITPAEISSLRTEDLVKMALKELGKV